MPEWLGSSAEWLWSGLKAIGVFLYAFFASGSGNALIGTLVGAGISAFVSYKLARRATRLERERRDEDRLERHRSRAYSLLFKLMRISTDAQRAYEHFEEARQRAIKDGLKGIPWTHLLLIANKPEPVKIDPEELIVVMQFKDDNLLNNVMNIEAMHSSVVEGISVFQGIRRDTTKDMPARFVAGSMVTELSAEQRDKLIPRFYEMDTLVQSLDVMITELHMLAQSVLPALGDKIRSELKVNTKVAYISNK